MCIRLLMLMIWLTFIAFNISPICECYMEEKHGTFYRVCNINMCHLSRRCCSMFELTVTSKSKTHSFIITIENSLSRMSNIIRLNFFCYCYLCCKTFFFVFFFWKNCHVRNRLLTLKIVEHNFSINFIYPPHKHTYIHSYKRNIHF